MGTVVGPLIQAIHFNGTSQYAWKSNPTFKDDSAGGISFWFRLTAVFTSDGTGFMVALADAGAVVGTFGKEFAFSIRRIAALGTGTFLDFFSSTDGSVTGVLVKAGSTSLAASVWYNAIFGSDGKIYLNGVEETYQYWRTTHFTSGWFSGFTAANKDFAAGGMRRAGGSFVTPFSGDMMNALYLSGRSFTSTEAAEIYAAGKSADPSTLSMFASLSPIWTFNGNTNDLLNAENLTAVATPTYISP